MRRSIALIAFALSLAALPANAEQTPQLLASDATDHLRPVNVSAEPAGFDGSKAIKLQIASGVKRALNTATGTVGLWICNGTVAHFRDVRIVRR